MKNTNFDCYGKYLLRTPLLPVSLFLETTNNKCIPERKLKELFSNEILQEAIFLASPDLYGSMLLWLENKLTDDKKKVKLINSLLKYFSRMSARCTPFGIFAGCSLGSISDKSKIVLNAKKFNQKSTRLDMNVLVNLSQRLSQNERIKKQVKFYPNTSMYKVKDNLRYIEYHYINNERKHFLTEVRQSKFLMAVLRISSNSGALLSQLIDDLMDLGLSEDVASSYISNLVESQIIVSDLEPSVTGDDFQNQITKILNEMDGVGNVVSLLDSVKNSISELEKKMGSKKAIYDLAFDAVSKLSIDFTPRFLFQTDMLTAVKSNRINKKVIESVKTGIEVLGLLTNPSSNLRMERFTEAFVEKFGQREVSLPKALDVEIGLNYLVDRTPGNVAPLVDDLVVPPRQEKTITKNFSKASEFLMKKINRANFNKESIIELNYSEIKDFSSSIRDVSNSISTIVQLVNIEGQEFIKLEWIGGSSGANLITRFSHLNKEIRTHVEKIVEKEEEMNDDSIMAEIIHLPEARVGNILMRPAVRAFEIPYLAKSNATSDNQLEIEDLFISVKNNKMRLVSKKLNKKVRPKLTNAHAFSNHSLPIYHFLCDMQTENKKSSLRLDIGPFESDYEFIPRIIYQNLILKLATWNLKKVEFEQCFKFIYSHEKLLKSIKELRERFELPRYVLLKEGDNELLIDLENVDYLIVFLEEIKNKDSVTLVEFLFAEENIVKDLEGNGYTNEIVLSFFRTNR